MTATIPIDSILGMLLPLSYDNKKWLADRLYENIHADSKTERMKARLGELSKLSQGWDGNNAQPVSTRVCNNMQAVLLCCQDNDIEQWTLFPDINGNLYLDLKSDDVDAGIILSDKSFSYFTDDKDEKDIPFSPDILLQVLRSINKIAA
ncbi:MAG: hypothetical protein IKQ59_01365 [Prevotella sp.]|nr:hypothetical protein [Prevotella sp.]